MEYGIPHVISFYPFTEPPYFEVFTLPGLIHMDSMWNDHGMVMEWLIPYGIQLYSTWIPLDSI